MDKETFDAIEELLNRHTKFIVTTILAVAKGEEEFMADAITQALTDLTTAVSSVTAELTDLVTQIQNDASASTETTNAAASIETLVGTLNSAVTSAQAAAPDPTEAAPPDPPAS